MTKRDLEYKLVQEEYEGNGWKVVVSSILLNRTRGEQVKGVIEEFFARWPTPESVSKMDEQPIAKLITPLGLMNTRANKIVRLSLAWQDSPPKNVEELRKLPGVGDYAIDSYRIFVLGERNFQPQDSVLKQYISRGKSVS